MLIVSFISEMLYWMAAVATLVVCAIHGGFPPAASIAVTIIVFCLNCLVPLCGLVGSAKKNRLLIFLYLGFSILQTVLWFANIVFCKYHTGAWCALKTCSAELEPAQSRPRPPACHLPRDRAVLNDQFPDRIA